MRIFMILLVLTGIAGCKQNPELPAAISPYRIDIQQGNVVTQEMVSKLKVGLTRSQVRYVLGSPLVADVFHADRWDYVYLLQRQGRPDERRRLTVIFDGDKLATLEGDVVLTEKVAEPDVPSPKPPATSVVPAPKPPPVTSATPAPATAASTVPASKPDVKPLATAPAPKPDTMKPAERTPVATTPVPAPESGVVAPAAWGKPAASAAAPKPETNKPPEKPQVAATPIMKPEVGPVVSAPASATQPAVVKAPEKPPVVVTPALKPEAAAVVSVAPAPQTANTEPAKPDAQRVAAGPGSKADAPKAEPAPKEAKNEQTNNAVFDRILDKVGF